MLHNSEGGRGLLVTFLSKTTVSEIIEAMWQLIKESIANKVKEVGMLSIQINTMLNWC